MGGSTTGGSATGGGASECEGSNAFQQAYVCAGSVYESRNVSQRSVRLYPVAASYACHTAGTDLTPFEDRDGEMGDPGAGAMEGSSIDDDWGMGGAGSSTGGSAMGGAGGGGSQIEDGWCADAPDGVAISGVTYSLNECGDGEVKLPIVFQEPENWYRLRVFHGDTACERGELVADTSGFGTGEIVELDVDGLEGGFVSLEFTAELEDYYDYYWDYDYYYYYGPYYYADALHLELEPLGPNLGGR